MNPNDFAKLAYEQGVQDALRDAGLIKKGVAGAARGVAQRASRGPHSAGGHTPHQTTADFSHVSDANHRSLKGILGKGVPLKEVLRRRDVHRSASSGIVIPPDRLAGNSQIARALRGELNPNLLGGDLKQQYLKIIQSRATG